MNDERARLLSQPLEAALAEFQPFLRADDLERSEAIEEAGTERLAEMAAAVKPLHDEINTVLDDLVGRQHRLPEDLEQLEYDLNSLAQAAQEAELELETRRSPEG